MKANKEIPLRVRLTESENKRLEAAAAKFGVSRSDYTRWALENSNTQVLGVQPNGQPALNASASMAKLKQVRKQAQKRVEPPPPVIEEVELPPEEVPDLATALGIPMFNTGPQEATFDDSSWE
jgi:hypothetical protein